MIKTRRLLCKVPTIPLTLLTKYLPFSSDLLALLTIVVNTSLRVKPTHLQNGGIGGLAVHCRHNTLLHDVAHYFSNDLPPACGHTVKTSYSLISFYHFVGKCDKLALLNLPLWPCPSHFLITLTTITTGITSTTAQLQPCKQ